MIHDESLSHTQLWEMAPAFNADLGCEDLYEPYARRYFDEAEWIWKNRSFHVADVLLRFLYPENAPAALLVELGDAWLESHPAETTDNALRRLLCMPPLVGAVSRSETGGGQYGTVRPPPVGYAGSPRCYMRRALRALLWAVHRTAHPAGEC